MDGDAERLDRVWLGEALRDVLFEPQSAVSHPPEGFREILAVERDFDSRGVEQPPRLDPGVKLPSFPLVPPVLFPPPE